MAKEEKPAQPEARALKKVLKRPAKEEKEQPQQSR